VSLPIVKLENPIQPYAWGSHQAIAALQGRSTPTRLPEAELWIGDHPTAPSRLASSHGGTLLSDWIARDPEAVLGSGRRHLPFLAKVLAAERSLSLQVHPDAEAARRGFEREELQQTSREKRCYPDPEAKHEVLVALSRFEALCGFRTDAEVAARLDAFPSLAGVRDQPGSAPMAARVLARVQQLDTASRARLGDEIAAFARAGDAESEWTSRLAEEHPGDPLAVAPVLLNGVVLEPGQGLIVRPGTLHSYLSGTGLEVMTRSDNVIRAGLTAKHVDVAELARVTRPEAGPPERIEARLADSGGSAYETGTDAFAIRVFELAGEASQRRPGGRVAVLLCVKGAVRVADPGGLALACGEAVLVPAGVEGYALRGAARTSTVFEVSSG